MTITILDMRKKRHRRRYPTEEVLSRLSGLGANQLILPGCFVFVLTLFAMQLGFFCIVFEMGSTNIARTKSGVEQCDHGSSDILGYPGGHL